MAVTNSGSVSNYWSRTTDLLNYNAPYTVALWVYLHPLVADQCFLALWGSNVAVDVDALQVQNHLGNYVLYAQSFINGSLATSETWGTTVIAAATWYHIALVKTSVTDTRMYLNGVQEGSTLTTNITGRSAILRHSVLASDAGTLGQFAGLDGRVASLKMWTRALTAANLVTEAQTLRPSDPTNLYGTWPSWAGASERVRDYSGNARSWTEVGTLTDENQPPVSYGAPSPSLWVNSLWVPPTPTLADLNRRAPYYTPVRIY